MAFSQTYAGEVVFTSPLKRLTILGNSTVSGVNSGDQSDASLPFSDITTNNSSTLKHGFLKKLTGSATVYMDGAGNWSSPPGVGTVTSVGISGADFTIGGSPVVGAGVISMAIANGVVTFAKIQNINTARLLGRSTIGVGSVEEITLGTNLSFTGTTLNAAATATPSLASVLAVGNTTGANNIIVNTGQKIIGQTDLLLSDSTTNNFYYASSSYLFQQWYDGLGTGNTDFLLQGGGTQLFSHLSMDIQCDTGLYGFYEGTSYTGTLDFTNLSANRNYAFPDQSGTIALTTDPALTTTITNDVATAVSVYPTWVTANTGSLPLYVSSTKMSLVPSTGVLTLAGDANIHGVTVGVGSGSILTNTAFGLSTLNANTTGSYNSGFGINTLLFNTIGGFNVAVGGQALLFNVAGSTSTAVGFSAMYYANNSAVAFNTYNTALGHQTLRGSTTPANNTGTNNTGLGAESLYGNTSGANNTTSGYQALYTNTTGSTNTAIGVSALRTNTTGSGLVALGYKAGYYETASDRLFIDNQDRGSQANARITSLIYGVFNASTASQLVLINGVLNVLESSTFTGQMNGNLTGNVTGNSSTSTLASTVTVADAAGDTTTFVMLAGAATGSLPVLTDAGLTYNATTDALTATTFIGALTGNADTATSATSVTGLVLPANGGTGIVNNNSSTLTISGAFATTLTVTAGTGVTLPVSGTLYSTLAGSITSAQMLSSISDETGTGVLVFSDSPTFTTQIISPIIYGSTTANGDITIEGTSSATKATANVILSPTGGRVGIGTSTPSTILSFGTGATREIYIESALTDVVGNNLNLQAGSTVAGTALSDLAGGSTTITAGLGTGTGASSIIFRNGTTLGTGMTLQTVSTKMTILGSGNVGIGITSPAHKLDVSNTTSTISALNINSTHTSSATSSVSAGTFVLDITPTSDLTTHGTIFATLNNRGTQGITSTTKGPAALVLSAFNRTTADIIVNFTGVYTDMRGISATGSTITNMNANWVITATITGTPTTTNFYAYRVSPQTLGSTLCVGYESEIAASTGRYNCYMVGTAQNYFGGNVGILASVPTSSLQVTGSVSFNYVAKTGTYTAAATDYTIDCTANTFTVNLPTAASITGRIYVIKNSGAGTITIDGSGSETIDGSTTKTLSVQYAVCTIQSNGTNWIVIAN